MIKLYEEIENGYFDEIDRNRAAELIQSGNGHLVFNHRYMNLQQERNNYKELYEKEISKKDKLKSLLIKKMNEYVTYQGDLSSIYEEILDKMQEIERL